MFGAGYINGHRLARVFLTLAMTFVFGNEFSGMRSRSRAGFRSQQGIQQQRSQTLPDNTTTTSNRAAKNISPRIASIIYPDSMHFTLIDTSEKRTPHTGSTRAYKSAEAFRNNSSTR